MLNSYESYPIKTGALDILNLPIHCVDVPEIHEFIDQVIQCNGKALVLNLNVHAVNLALLDPKMRHLYDKAQLIFCDGDGVRWGMKILGKPIPPKITYDRWIWQLAAFSRQHGYSLYFLGSRPGIAQKAAEEIRAKNPGLRIVGTHDGFFDKSGEGNEKVVNEINRLKPDILIVGFGMPIQEHWLHANWQKLNAHIFLNGGAVFDCASGDLPSPPQWMIRAQLEWLYRFYQQPARRFKRYFIGIPAFFLRILKEKFFGSSEKKPTV